MDKEKQSRGWLTNLGLSGLVTFAYGLPVVLALSEAQERTHAMTERVLLLLFLMFPLPILWLFMWGVGVWAIRAWTAAFRGYKMAAALFFPGLCVFLGVSANHDIKPCFAACGSSQWEGMRPLAEPELAFLVAFHVFSLFAYAIALRDFQFEPVTVCSGKVSRRTRHRYHQPRQCHPV